MFRRPSQSLLVISLVSSVAILAACGGGGGGSNPPQSISVSLSPAASQAIDQGQTIQFTATVTNDSSSKGVTWSKTGGSLSGQTSTAATFTAGSPGSASITATSVADPTKSATTTITIAAAVPTLKITTTSPLPSGSVGGLYSATLQSTGGTAPISWSATSLPAGLTVDATTGAITGAPTASGTASVMVQATDAGNPQQTAQATLSLSIAQLMITTTSLLNPMLGEAYNQTLLATDSGGTGPVIWSLASGSSLPAGLNLASNGAITGTPTGAAGTTNFTVQAMDASVPPQQATQALSLTVTPASNCGTGSESLLSGQYAMALTGFDAGGPVGLLASFTADGSGNITAGMEDLNSTGGVQSNVPLVIGSSSYSIGSDHRGCLTLATSSGSRVFHIAVGILSGSVATSGRSVEFDSTGTNVAGSLQIQQASAFSNAKVSGNFAFIANAPLPASGGFFAAVGAMNLSGSTVTGVCDMNFNGVIDPGNTGYPNTPLSMASGTYNIGSKGRGTMSFAVPISGTPTTIDLVVYVLNATQFFVMSSDSQSATKSLFAGFAGQQTGVPYANSSLNATSILFASGQSAAGGASSRVEAGVFTPDGAGNFTLAGDVNSAGTVSTLAESGTYSVTPATGRVLLTNTGSPSPNLVMYIVLSDWGYFLSPDSNAMVGDLEPQSGGPFTNGTLNGNFSFGTIVPVVSGSPLNVGETTFDGAGNVSTTFDVNEGGFLSIDNVVTNTYGVSPAGRVVTPAGGTTLKAGYLTNSGTIINFGVTATDTDPAIQVMDQ